MKDFQEEKRNSRQLMSGKIESDFFLEKRNGKTFVFYEKVNSQIL